MGPILITGGLGFIGSNLANHFLSETDETVIIYDNLFRKDVVKNKEWLIKRFDNSRLKIIVGDICNFQQLKKVVVDVEKIFHVAGQVAVTFSVSDPKSDFEANAKGTLNVLEVARQLKTDPILFLTSTNKVYGALESYKVIEEKEKYNFKDMKQGIAEDAPIDPHSPYGCSKYCADAYFKDYFRIYGLKTVVFRMSCIYGIRQFGTEDQGWVAHFIISSLKNRKLMIYGDGKQIRDILFVQDLIRALELSLKNIKTTKGEVYNIGGGPQNTISLLELITMLEKLLNHKINFEYSDWRPGDQKVYYSNINKAKKDFNWMPSISKEEGIQKLFNWCTNNLYLFSQ